jgi:purine-nucleoside phosphorylase
MLVFGRLRGKNVMAMKGRFHAYEGYSYSQVVHPIRVMKQLGVNTLLLSNAAGGLNPIFRQCDLMLIDDHINLHTSNPLIGPNDDSLGTRFPDMSAPYDAALNAFFRLAAAEHSIELREGVYVSVPGPMLETRAEYRFLRKIGADAVGMSTVPEVIAARHLNMRCAAVSVITDECDPDNLHRVELAAIIAAAKKADATLSRLFTSVIAAL